MSTPTETQQLDALWEGLRSGKYWISLGISPRTDGEQQLNLYEHDPDRGIPVEIFRSFTGTRAECIAQLIAFQVAERLS